MWAQLEFDLDVYQVASPRRLGRTRRKSPKPTQFTLIFPVSGALLESTDKDLAMLVRLGDKRAAEMLLTRYRTLIYHQAYGVSKTESDELTAYLRSEFVRRIPRYRVHPTVGFAGWAKMVVRRIRLDWSRSKPVLKSVSIDSIPADVLDGDGREESFDELELGSALRGLTEAEQLRVARMIETGRTIRGDERLAAFLSHALRGVSGGVIQDALDLIPVPRPQDINTGLRSASARTLVRLLGEPRRSYSSDCQPITNKRLAERIVYSEAVTPRLRVAGERLAVQSLKAVLDDVRLANPDLYARLGSAGMLCCRYVRGSHTVISNHSWGTAIDLTIDGKLDTRGDDKVQRGLLEIYKHFHKHGWYWGAEFGVEDAMHFEISEEKAVELYGKGA